MSERQAVAERLRAFLAGAGEGEVSEDGDLLFLLPEARFRLEEAEGRLLLHLWSGERNWARRVLAVAEETPERLVLRVERFGRRPGKLVVTQAGSRAAVRERAAARKKYGAWLHRLVEREFPRARLEHLSTAPDLKRSFSGLYARACLVEEGRWWAVLGVNAGEASVGVDGILAGALIWLDWNRQRHPERAWAGLRLFLPAGRAETTAHRAAYLDRERWAVELYAVDEEEWSCTRQDVRDFGNVRSVLPSAKQAEEVLSAESSAVQRIRTLAPEAIELAVSASGSELVLSFRGLPFARAAGGVVRFGLGRNERVLGRKNFPALKALVARLERERAPERSAASALFRARPERWLESLVRAQPQLVDARLDPTRIYRQVPVVSGGERGVADLLGVARDGQLVVVELKASADPQLPLQGLDYWECVRWHHERSELARHGYFPGIPLKPDPPELLLVCPALQVHPTTEALLRYLAPEVRVTLVGLNQDWRRQLKVVWRRGRG